MTRHYGQHSTCPLCDAAADAYYDAYDAYEAKYTKASAKATAADAEGRA